MRIIVNPDQLRHAAQSMRGANSDMQGIGSRIGSIVGGLHIEVRARANVDGQAAVARRQAGALANQAEALARFLEDRADAFQRADEQTLPSPAMQSVLTLLLRGMRGGLLGSLLGSSVFNTLFGLGGLLRPVKEVGVTHLIRRGVDLVRDVMGWRAKNEQDHTSVMPETESEKVIYDLRDEINGAACDAATPELIGAILNDEIERRNIIDTVQDVEAEFIRVYEGRLESIERELLESIVGEPIEEMSLGIAQMTPNVVHGLVEQGYVTKPDNWDSDWLDISITWLADEERAPQLVP